MEKLNEHTLFTKDKTIMILSIASGLLALATVISVLIRLKSHDFKVPVQYIVNDGSVVQSSSWYSLYSLALIALFGAVASIFLAYRLHKGNRIFAIGLLVIYIVIALFGFLISNALLGLVSRV
jgi:hypothetical protein